MQGHRLLGTFAVVSLLAGLVLSGSGQGQAVLAQDAGPASPGPEASVTSTAFTYQGQLKADGAPAQGTYWFAFTLWDAAQNGHQVGTGDVEDNVAVTNGLFTVTLNKTGQFGADAFSGAARWLEIKVCKPRPPLGCAAIGTTLSPRQEITATPYALYAAGNWGLGGNANTTPGTHFLGTTNNQALELKVNGARALRIEPNATSPNLIGGYSGNAVGAGYYGATIGGGGLAGSTCGLSGAAPCWNRVNDFLGTVGGGSSNTAGVYATVGGGGSNTASGPSATVGGGSGNTASYLSATVGGGWINTASGGSATVGGGWINTASGGAATVPGGYSNTASGEYSFAAGRRAKATHNGSFVWGDATDADIASTADNQFKARASGGVYFYTRSDLSTGVYVAANGGAWNSVSDRNAKENFAAVDGQALLDGLARVPITTWNYKGQDTAIRHIGPVAQDFYAAFGVGEDDKHISTLDPDGVALAASQALYRLAQEQASQIAALQAENAALKANAASQQEAIAGLEVRMAALEARVGGGAAPVAGRWGCGSSW